MSSLAHIPVDVPKRILAFDDLDKAGAANVTIHVAQCLGEEVGSANRAEDFLEMAEAAEVMLSILGTKHDFSDMANKAPHLTNCPSAELCSCWSAPSAEAANAGGARRPLPTSCPRRREERKSPYPAPKPGRKSGTHPAPPALPAAADRKPVAEKTEHQTDQARRVQSDPTLHQEVPRPCERCEKLAKTIRAGKKGRKDPLDRAVFDGRCVLDINNLDGPCMLCRRDHEPCSLTKKTKKTKKKKKKANTSGEQTAGQRGREGFA